MYADLSKIEHNYRITEFPLNVAIEVTNNCNLNCTMCQNDQLTRKRGYMSMTLYKRIIDEVAKENKGTRIWLDFYGEPLLAGWKLYYMIDYAKKKGLTNVCINTNGTLMNKEYADMLLDAGVDFISLDCDGYSKKVYESIRVNGNRDIFYANVEYLLEEKKRRNSDVVIDVKVIEMDENRDEIPQIVKHWSARGAWTAVRRCADWVFEKNPVGEPVQNDNRIACGHLIGTLVVTWNGEVAQCAWDANASNIIGDVNKETIKTIWGRHNRELCSVHMNHEWDKLNHLCKNCADWKYVGEERYDEQGNKIEKNYDSQKKML